MLNNVGFGSRKKLSEDPDPLDILNIECLLWWVNVNTGCTRNYRKSIL